MVKGIEIKFLVVIQDLTHKYISEMLKGRYFNMFIFIINLMKYGGQTFFLQLCLQRASLRAN